MWTIDFFVGGLVGICITVAVYSFLEIKRALKNDKDAAQD